MNRIIFRQYPANPVEKTALFTRKNEISLISVDMRSSQPSSAQDLHILYGKIYEQEHV